MTVVVRSRSWVGKYARALDGMIPSSLRLLLEGARPTARIDDVEAPARFGSIDVVVPADLVLRTHLSLPKANGKDLPHAIDLLLRERTPFEASEVIVDAEEQEPQEGSEQADYVVRILPFALLERARARWGVRLAKIGAISVLEPSGDRIETDFALALSPTRLYTRWIAVLPLALLLGAFVLFAIRDLSDRQLQVSSLGTAIQSAAITAKSLSDELEARGKASSGTKAVIALVESTPSAFATLEALRHALPAPTHITEMELQAGETRLSVRSTNVLADMQKIGSAQAQWQATIQGAITASPQGDGEIGTIVLHGSGHVKE